MALRGFIFVIFTKKKTRKEFEQFGLKIQKISGRKMYSCTLTFGTEVHPA